VTRRRFLKHAVAAALCVMFVAETFGVIGVTQAAALPYRQFEKGMSYFSFGSTIFLAAGSDRSLRDLAATGTNWVSLIATWYQHSENDSVIAPTGSSPTDGAIIHAIGTIHSLGMKVLLKPQVDTPNGRSHSQINPSNVTGWFASYTAFILYYAEIAQRTGVEQLSVGCELEGTSAYTQAWIDVIRAVRGAYSGALTYAANWDEWQHIRFARSLDYLGVDAYFPLTDKQDPTLAELKTAWQPYENELEKWSLENSVPIVFTEIGYWSVPGAAEYPGSGNLANLCDPSSGQYNATSCKPDQKLQANLYEAALETFWNKPWFRGVFWWTWYPYGRADRRGEGGPNDIHISPHNKTAEQVLRTWYAKPYVPDGTPTQAVPALLAIQNAENATAHALRDSRTIGLDRAEDLLTQAVSAYDSGNYESARQLAGSAVSAATGAVAIMPASYYAALALAVITASAMYLFLKKRTRVRT